MSPLLIILLIVFASSFLYSAINPKDEVEDIATQAKPALSKEEKAKLVPQLGIVYVGMPKEDLEKAGYDELTPKGYRKEGNEEWITYLNWANPEKDTVTFYIVDGKVKGWKEQ